MSSDEDVAICMWYTLQNLEQNHKKKKYIRNTKKKVHTNNYCLVVTNEKCGHSDSISHD